MGPSVHISSSSVHIRLFTLLMFFYLSTNFRNQLETTVKAYNHYYDVHGGSGGVKSREVNGRFVLEGVLRLYWGVHSVIQLKEDDDQRLSSSIVTSKYRRRVVSNGVDFQVR